MYRNNMKNNIKKRNVILTNKSLFLIMDNKKEVQKLLKNKEENSWTHKWNQYFNIIKIIESQF